MTRQQAKSFGFTHKAVMYNFIPIYFKMDGNEVKAINGFYDVIFDIVSFVDSLISNKWCFEIKIIEEL